MNSPYYIAQQTFLWREKSIYPIVKYLEEQTQKQDIYPEKPKTRINECRNMNIYIVHYKMEHP